MDIKKIKSKLDKLSVGYIDKDDILMAFEYSFEELKGAVMDFEYVDFDDWVETYYRSAKEVINMMDKLGDTFDRISKYKK